MGTKLVELFANWVIEIRNMMNDYLRGRACIEGVRGSVDFELFLLFCDFAAFCTFCWLLWFFFF
jgi:hypothetical protein